MFYFQSQDDTVNRDMYVPNPSCTEYHKYEWLGKLMGACIRGKECLVGNNIPQELKFFEAKIKIFLILKLIILHISLLMLPAHFHDVPSIIFDQKYCRKKYKRNL